MYQSFQKSSKWSSNRTETPALNIPKKTLAPGKQQSNGPIAMQDFEVIKSGMQSSVMSEKNVQLKLS